MKSSYEIRPAGPGGFGGKIIPHAAGLAIVATALLIRVCYVLSVRDNPLFEPMLPGFDMTVFHEWAKRIAAGQLTDHRPFYQAPLYPYLLGTIYSVFGPNALAATMFQAILGAASVGLIYLLGHRLFGRGVALWAAGLMALTPIFPYYEGFLKRDSMVVFLNLLFLWTLFRHDERRPLRSASLAGAVLGLAALARANALVMLPLGMVWVWKRAGADMGTRWMTVAVFVLAAFATISPATAHNRLAGGQWVLIEGNFAQNWRVGNSLDSTGGYSEPRGALAPLLSADFVRLQGKKLSKLLSDYEEPNNLNFYHFRRYNAWLRMPVLSWGFFLAFGLAGIWLTRRRLRELYPLHGYLVLYGLSLVAFFVTSRFRLPLWPVLILFGAAALDNAVARLRQRRGSAAAILFAPGLAAVVFAGRSDKIIQAQYFDNMLRVCEERGLADWQVRELEDRLALYPADPGSLMKLSLIHHQSGRGEDALSVAERLIVDCPGFAPGWYGAARLAHELGYHDRAADFFVRYLELNPGAPDRGEIERYIASRAAEERK